VIWETVAVGHVFHQLIYHFAWSTHSRVALIRRDYRPMLLKIINEEAKRLGGWPIRHNAMPDHVHLLSDHRRKRLGLGRGTLATILSQ
jgi:REP element-mobilizing transposase RayT